MDSLTFTTSGTNKVIDLTIKADTTSDQSISFVLNIPNPSSQTITSSDMDLEVQINSNKIFNVSPLSTDKSFDCDTGCTGCNTNYYTCTGCDASFTFIASTSNCAVNPSAKSLTWSDSMLGNTGETTIKITVNKTFSSGSKFQFTFSNKFDITSSNIS